MRSADARVRRLDVADPRPTSASRSRSNAAQPDLDGARVVETGIGREIDVQPLGQRRQPLHALRAVEEGRRAGDQQVQAGEPAAVDLVDQLAQGVEALLPHVARTRWSVSTSSRTSSRPAPPGVAEDRQQPREEVQRRRNGRSRP